VSCQASVPATLVADLYFSTVPGAVTAPPLNEKSLSRAVTEAQTEIMLLKVSDALPVEAPAAAAVKSWAPGASQMMKFRFYCPGHQ
jgi:hypothetical protein